MAAEALMLDKNRPLCPVVIDNMEDEASLHYGASPERLYVVKDGRIMFAGRIGPMGYIVEEVRDWLVSYAAQIKGSKQSEHCNIL